jgi:hypothetical protein
MPPEGIGSCINSTMGKTPSLQEIIKAFGTRNSPINGLAKTRRTVFDTIIPLLPTMAPREMR